MNRGRSKACRHEHDESDDDCDDNLRLRLSKSTSSTNSSIALPLPALPLALPPDSEYDSKTSDSELLTSPTSLSTNDLNDTVRTWLELEETPTVLDDNIPDNELADASRPHDDGDGEKPTWQRDVGFSNHGLNKLNSNVLTVSSLSTHSLDTSSTPTSSSVLSRTKTRPENTNYTRGVLNKTLSTHELICTSSEYASLSTQSSDSCSENGAPACPNLQVTLSPQTDAGVNMYNGNIFSEVRFNPPIGTDTIKISGEMKVVKTKMQVITAMEEVQNFSLEELRFMSLPKKNIRPESISAQQLPNNLTKQDNNTGKCDETAGPNPKRRRKSLHFPSPIDVLQMDCCVDKCLRHLSIVDIETCQLLLKDKKEDEQLNYVLREVTTHTLLLRKGESYKFVISGKSVCKMAWCKAFNVASWRFKKCVKALRNGTRKFQHGNRGRRRMTAKTTNALGWMRHHFERIGDYMPHKTEVHLPSTWKKADVYLRMKNEFLERGIPSEKVVSPSYFSHLWLQHLPEFVIKKKREFTVCATCSELKDRALKANTEREQAEIKAIKKEHDDRVGKERSAYHNMRERAQRESSEYSVLIVDGMDQSKTDIPRVVKDKDLAPLNKVHVHLTGVLFHTNVAEGKIPYVYIDVKEIPHDSNLTMNIIMDVLKANRERLGRTLFLQLDNCFRENKNRFLLSFATLLVESRVFEEVIIHFLPVGHTHEDVDQMFSCISRSMDKQDAIYTLEDLKFVLERSFTPMIQVKSATPLLNIKEWIEPHMAGRFQNHSKPLWFRFRRGDTEEAEVLMHYKMWVDDSWLPVPQYGADDQIVVDESSLGLRCLQTVPDISAIPDWVIPSLDKLDVEGLRKDLPWGYAHRMPADRQQWWQDYMSALESLTEIPSEPETWSLEELAHRISKSRPLWEPDDGLQRLKSKVGANCPTIRIGRQGVVDYKQVTHVDSYETLKAEDLAVVNLEGCTSEQQPSIGKVLEVCDNEVNIHWMEGKYKGKWKECFQGAGRNRTRMCDRIPLQSILMFGFFLTPGNQLRAENVKQMKVLYSELN